MAIVALSACSHIYVDRHAHFVVVLDSLPSERGNREDRKVKASQRHCDGFTFARHNSREAIQSNLIWM